MIRTLIIVILAIVFVIMFTYTIYLAIQTENFVAAVQASADATGFCLPSNSVFCTFEPNDSLGALTSPLTTFSVSNALILADLIGRLEHKDVLTPPTFTFLTTLSANGSPIFVGVWTQDVNMQKVVTIAFRGTQTLEEVQNDLRFQQTPLQTAPWPTKPDVLAHTGFVDQLNFFLTRLDDIVGQQVPDVIVLAGHSLGAAVATLYGYHRLINTSIPATVYAFASPRVGNSEFAINVTYPLFRITNTTDLVPLLPFPVMFNLQSPHPPWIYQDAGTNYAFTRNWGSIDNNHLLPIYINALTTCALEVTPLTICANP